MCKPKKKLFYFLKLSAPPYLHIYPHIKLPVFRTKHRFVQKNTTRQTFSQFQPSDFSQTLKTLALRGLISVYWAHSTESEFYSRTSLYSEPVFPACCITISVINGVADFSVTHLPCSSLSLASLKSPCCWFICSAISAGWGWLRKKQLRPAANFNRVDLFLQLTCWHFNKGWL